MSTWTNISIGNFTLYDTQNDYYQWYFQEGDRVREIAEEEAGFWSEETFIGYRTTVAQMRRRLQLNGYDRALSNGIFRLPLTPGKRILLRSWPDLKAKNIPMENIIFNTESPG